MAILFNVELDGFKLAKSREKKAWIKKTCTGFGYKIDELSYTFVSDDDLLAINIEHLNHDFYTDIITFDLSDAEDQISGDIYISIDRVKENAANMSVTFEDELNRVLIHGVLHLMGFGDKTETEELEMRRQENLALGLFHVEQ